MKLSNVFAKLTGGNVRVFGALGGLALAGVVMTAAAPAANAQVTFGVEVGTPRYYSPAPTYAAPGYYAPGYVGYGQGYGYGYDQRAYWEHRRAEEFREHEWREHERWEHHRDFDRDRDWHRDDRGWR